MSKRLLKQNGSLAAVRTALKSCLSRRRAAALSLCCCSIFISSACSNAAKTAVVKEDVNSSLALKQSFKDETPSMKETEESVQTQSITGTYEFKAGSRSNEIKILEISPTELKVSFLGNAEFDSQMGPMANSGEIPPTTVKFKTGKAVLTPEDSPDCRITLVFAGNKVEITQNENDCGFPGGVLADGTYRKTSGKPPVFDEELNSAASDNKTENAQPHAAERVRFPAGSNSSAITGTITDGGTVTYLIGARTGQTMAIKVIDGGANNDVVFDVAAPDGTRLGGDRMYDHWSRPLPKTGDYVVTVSAIESQNAVYKLQFTIR